MCHAFLDAIACTVTTRVSIGQCCESIVYPDTDTDAAKALELVNDVAKAPVFAVAAESVVKLSALCSLDFMSILRIE
jgi:hypothetical protein